MSQEKQDHSFSPSTEEAAHTQLSHFIASQQWQRARDTAAKLLTANPDSAWLHYKLGTILNRLDDHKRAETHLKKAIALQPDLADAFAELGMVHLSLGRTGTAEDNLRTAISIDPLHDHAWAALAHITLHFEDPENAIRHANRALELNPSSHIAHDVLIRARGEQKGKTKTPAAQRIAEFTKLLARNPEDDLSHARIGDIYFEELTDYQKAETHYRKALALAPDDKDHQKQVIAALRKRDLFLRLLWLPFLPCKLIITFVTFVGDATSGDLKLKNLPILLLALPMLFFIKYLIPLLAVSFLLFGTIFWPLTKSYEFFTIADIHQKLGKITVYRGPLAKIHKLPFAIRFTLFALTVILFWAVVGSLLIHPETSGHTAATFVVAAISLTALFFIIGIPLAIYTHFQEKSRARKTAEFLNQ